MLLSLSGEWKMCKIRSIKIRSIKMRSIKTWSNLIDPNVQLLQEKADHKEVEYKYIYLYIIYTFTVVVCI